jgi:Secretion system C-terminal sorting domain
MLRLFPSIVPFLLPFLGMAQQDTIFRSLSVSQVEDGVLINFTIRGGITCSGVEVERSADGVNFIVIHEIEGVCGAINADESYSVTDNNPIKNKTAIYRLDLGSLGIYSKIVYMRYIDYNPYGITVFPNPCANYCTIFFSNPTNEPHELGLFNRLGQEVLREVKTDDVWYLPAPGFTPGIYYYSIKKENEERFSGKLVIL